MPLAARQMRSDADDFRQVGKTRSKFVWTPDDRFAYIANEDSNDISVINAATSQVTATIPTGATPSSIAVLANGRQAYVSNSTIKLNCSGAC